MTLTTVNDRGLTTPIDLLDSEKIRFGTGDDLQIYHSGSHAYITNTTNSLLLESGSTVLRSPSQENYLVGTLNGSVDLYFDNVKKIESTSGGAQIVNGTGNTQLNIRGGSSDGTATIQFIADDNAANNDNFRLQNGASNDFYLQNYASGSWETNIKAVGDGAVELYHNGTKKLETTADGVKLPVSGADKKSSIKLDGTNGSSELQGVILESDGENALFHIKAAAGGGTPSDKFTINAISGNCGIGTISPDTLLDVSSSDDAVVRIQSEGSDATDDARLEIKTTNGTFIIQNDRSIGTSGALTFAGNTSNNLVIDHDTGNVGINETAPTGTTHIKSHSNGWEGGILLEEQNATTGWAIHPDNSDELMIGRNTDTSSSISTHIASFTTDGLKLASGKGIDFSATADGSSSPNELLEDYEEGYWDMTCNNTLRTTHDRGWYVKVGHMVTCGAYVQSDQTTTNTDSLTFTLPFATSAAPVGGDTGWLGPCSTNNFIFDTGRTQTVISAGDASSISTIRQMGDSVTWVAMGRNQFTDGRLMQFTMTYKCA